MNIAEIAPWIRGLACSGRRAPVVRYSEKCCSAGGVLQVAAASDAEALRNQISAVWRSSFDRGKALPSAVNIDGIGCFVLGEDFDDSERRAGLLYGGSACPFEPEVSGGDGGSHRNRIAVVTGGAQGFGAGLVENLTEKGWLVYIADMNFAGASDFADKVNRTAGRTCAVPVEVNVSDEASVEAMVERIAAVSGGVDLFVNNAGVLRAGSVKEQSLADFEFVTKVNYTGYFICVKFVSRLLALQNRAAGGYFTDIIQINSKSGLEGSNKNGAYAGGKFGGIGLTQSFALELVADCIKVNSVCPGNFFEGPLWSDPEKGLFVQYLKAGKVPGAQSVDDVKRFYEAKVPMGRGCRPQDVARAVFYLVDQLYETGQALPVTGGQVMLN